MKFLGGPYPSADCKNLFFLVRHKEKQVFVQKLLKQNYLINPLISGGNKKVTYT